MRLAPHGGWLQTSACRRRPIFMRCSCGPDQSTNHMLMLLQRRIFRCKCFGYLSPRLFPHPSPRVSFLSSLFSITFWFAIALLFDTLSFKSIFFVGGFYFLPLFTLPLYNLPLFSLTFIICHSLLCNYIICPLTDRAHIQLQNYPSFLFVVNRTRALCLAFLSHQVMKNRAAAQHGPPPAE
jgi:hypothetical protein